MNDTVKLCVTIEFRDEDADCVIVEPVGIGFIVCNVREGGYKQYNGDKGLVQRGVSVRLHC